MKYTEKYGEWALVLGATEGVGQAVAEKVASLGMNVILVGRRIAKLEVLAKKMEEKYGIKAVPLCADFDKDSSADEVCAKVADYDIGFVSYVACASLFSRVIDTCWEDNRRMIQVNIVTFTRFMLYFAKYFAKKGKGFILNISSEAGTTGYPALAEYSSGKSYISCFTRSLAYEFAGTNVDVGIAILGATTSPAYCATLPEGEIGEAMKAAADSCEYAISTVFENLDKLPVIPVNPARCAAIPCLTMEEAKNFMISYGFL